MKIGLLSPYYSQNYGTVLQAFALAKAIRNLGSDCEYLQWRRCKPAIINRILFFIKHPLFALDLRRKKSKRKSDLSYNFLNLSDFQLILKKNKEFVDQFTPVSTQQYYLDTLKNTSQYYDRFIVGSDQTWSPNDMYRFSPYYLFFLGDDSKKFSYAASMGTLYLPQEYLSYISKRLAKFNKLSCRDEKNTRVLSNLLKRDVEHVVDPTLLLSRDEWKKYMQPVEMPTDYILCYRLGEKKCINDYAEFLGREKNIPVYYIETRPDTYDSQNVLKGIGVREFLWLIDHCRYMVTDSYHGTIFSLNFAKNVVSFDKRDGIMFDNGRIFDVLSSYNIAEHYFQEFKEFIPTDIDFASLNSALSERRHSSFSYLKDVISNN